MGFGKINTAECVNVAPGADPRCADPAFALANPSVCPVEPQLIIKPAVSLVCALGSVQFRAFYVANNTELDVTDETVFQSSDPNTAVVGAQSGNATGLSAGNVQISATYLGKTAFADLDVLGGDCCADRTVAMMLVVDRTKSMSQAFNINYASKLAFAKAAATRFIEEVNEQKDLVGLMQFTDTSNEVLSSPVSDKDAVAALVPGIAQSTQNTTFYDALTTAIAELAAVTADTKMLVIISDFEDTDTSYLDDDNPIALLNDFKTQGGIVMCVGIRAHDAGYALASAFSTGGFFINAYDGIEDLTLDYMSGLKGYVCAGNCTPTGDTFQASGALNYCSFEKWNVIDGNVDLIGNGFMDLLPGNGLYVDLAGSTSPYKGTMVTKETIAVEEAKQYRLSVRLAGNQRVDATPNTVRLKVFSRNNDGLDNPSVPPSLNLVDGGDPLPESETHEYAYSYVNANGETELSPSGSVIVTTDGPLVSIDCPANANATLVRIYRKYAGTWYLIAEADPNSPLFDDTDLDSALAAKITAGTISSCDRPSDTNTTGTPIYFLNQSVTINDFQQDFTLISNSFIAPGDADVYISIQQTDTPAGFDATGLLLDSVRFESVTDLITLFSDEFDGENMQYIPPACGIGGNYVLIDEVNYGYAVGYNCYGEGCLDEPPAAQAEDPNPLPDVESGFTPPQVFTSTKTVCPPCGAGFTNLGLNLVPTMTSNIAPSGVASASSELTGFEAFKAFNKTVVPWAADDASVPAYVQYQFTSAKTVRAYGIQSYKTSLAPKAWTLQGSNNGTTWTDIDERENIPWANAQLKRYLVASPGSYTYYRLLITELAPLIGGSATTVNVAELELFEVPQTATCATATAESELSQGAADAEATAEATAAAQALMNCVAIYTATETYTANCPVGTYGQPVTKSVTKQSLNSLPEAQAEALAEATELAEAELDCTQSNNDQEITIVDRTAEATGPASAIPFPSVQFLSDIVGTIQSVTVDINLFSHNFPDDVHVILRSPSGTVVSLFRNAGGNNPASGLNFVFDDAGGGTLPDSTALASGTFQCSNHGVEAPLPSPGPAGPYGTALADFAGEDPNGSWALYVMDDTTGGAGVIGSWAVHIVLN